MAQLSAPSFAAQVTKKRDIDFGDVEHCNVTSDGRGAQQISHEWPPFRGRGASLLLEERIFSWGAVTFSGRLTVQGRAELRTACVTVYGDCTVIHRAELRVENCSNVNPWIGGGGGVYVNGDLHVDGALEVHQSRASVDGGCVFMWGTSAQRVEPWHRA